MRGFSGSYLFMHTLTLPATVANLPPVFTPSIETLQERLAPLWDDPSVLAVRVSLFLDKTGKEHWNNPRPMALCTHDGTGVTIHTTPDAFINTPSILAALGAAQFSLSWYEMNPHCFAACWREHEPFDHDEEAEIWLYCTPYGMALCRPEALAFSHCGRTLIRIAESTKTGDDREIAIEEALSNTGYPPLGIIVRPTRTTSAHHHLQERATHAHMRAIWPQLLTCQQPLSFSLILEEPA